MRIFSMSSICARTELQTLGNKEGPTIARALWECVRVADPRRSCECRASGSRHNRRRHRHQRRCDACARLFRRTVTEFSGQGSLQCHPLQFICASHKVSRSVQMAGPGNGKTQEARADRNPQKSTEFPKSPQTSPKVRRIPQKSPQNSPKVRRIPQKSSEFRKILQKSPNRAQVAHFAEIQGNLRKSGDICGQLGPRCWGTLTRFASS